MNPLVTAEISAEAIRQNLSVLRDRIPAGTSLCPVVKADAYGHSLEQVLPVLSSSGIERLAIANLIEGIQLRRLGWCGSILCFAPMLAIDDERERRERAELAIAEKVTLTVMSGQETQELAAAAARRQACARIEIKVDTGMGRMGLAPESAEKLVSEAAGYSGIVIEGVYTHFASADENDLTFTKVQLQRFLEIKARLSRLDMAVGQFHAANSAALFRLLASHLDRVRPGLSLYGYWPGPAAERPGGLRPCMRVVSHLTAVRRLSAGHGIGYGRTFVTSRDSVIGVVPIGYEDGYRRSLSNEASMTLEPVRDRSRYPVPVVGRVSMDQTTVDLTEAGDVRVGDEITVIDNDPAAPNSVESLARQLGTIPYEITCLLGQRVKRVSAPCTAEHTEPVKKSGSQWAS